MLALTVTDSRLVIRVENVVATSSLEDLEVDLNGAVSNYVRLDKWTTAALPVWCKSFGGGGRRPPPPKNRKR